MRELLTKYPYIIYFILIVSLSIFYMISCEKNPSDPSDEIVLPDSNLSYSQHIQPLFFSKCASESGCHSPNIGGGPARGLDLTNYGVIRTHMIDGSELIVIEFQATESFLYNILLQPLSGRRRMPPDRESLSPNNIQGIKTWIDEGAPF
jgi:hypothetical protein